MYKIDNRRKNHKGRYTILGIVLGIILTGASIYLYDHNRQPILDNVNEVKQFAIKQIPKDSPIVAVVNDNPVVKPSQPVDNSQQVTQPETYTLDQLRQIALDDINQYRTQSGLNPIPMQNARASQIWADHLLSEGCIAHREGNSGPEQRYLDNGDKLQMIFENVSGGYGTSSMDIISSIKQADSEMINDDSDQNNAHRNNILNPRHNSVSIGIAYDSQRMILVQDFQEPSIGNLQYWDNAYTDVKSCW